MRPEYVLNIQHVVISFGTSERQGYVDVDEVNISKLWDGQPLTTTSCSGSTTPTEEEDKDIDCYCKAWELVICG